MRQPIAKAVALGGAAAVVLVGLLVSGTLEHRDVALRASLEMMFGVVAALTGLLLVGRFLQRGRLGDLLLAAALVSLAVTNVVAGVVPVVAARPESWPLWTRLPALILATAGFAAAAFVLDRPVRRPRAALAAALALVALLQVSVVAVTAVLGDALPPAVVDFEATGASEWGDEARSAAVAGHLLVVLLYAVAAVGFTRAARAAGDRLLRWLGLGAALAAFAHLNYAAFPSLYSEAVSAGDVFRFAFYLCILIGSVREVAQYQRSLTASAVLEERRRVARELHDGLAQELAYIVTQTRLLASSEPDNLALRTLESVAQRALDESRLAIGALTRPGYEPLDVALAAAAEEIAYRAGVDVAFELAPGIDVEPRRRDAMVRIVREAMTNAIRHGEARTVRIELANGDGLCLRVSDDGRGFAPEAIERDGRRGFGLTSMRERAEALGGRFHLVSRPGAGTAVEVRLP